MKNFGTAATNVDVFLETNDSYITIHDGVANFGDIASGDSANNVSDPFVVEASPGTPMGHLVNFSIIANSSGGYRDTSYFSLCVGKYHYFVWDPTSDQSSGPTINATLQGLGYTGFSSQILPSSDLDNYFAILVSVGIFPNNYVIQNGSPEATALVNFVNSGGRMYLEGGDVWYYDPMGSGYDFGPLFGINATADGTGDLSTVQGQSGTFTTGMNFSYGGENSWIDHISPTGSGVLIFRNSSPVYDCGVANDAGSYRTVGVSFEIAGLVDGSPPSTKAALLDSIMTFFIPASIEEKPSENEVPEVLVLTQNFPNPFSKETSIKYSIPQSAHVSISLYDISGRRIKSLVNEDKEPGHYTLRINGKDLRAGIYFIRLDTQNATLSHKCMVIK